MKADANGTPVEQARARMGWKPRAQILTDGGDLTRCCSNCNWRYLLRVNRRDGGIDFRSNCNHREAGGSDGHATRESATCSRWEIRP